MDHVLNINFPRYQPKSKLFPKLPHHTNHTYVIFSKIKVIKTVISSTLDDYSRSNTIFGSLVSSLVIIFKDAQSDLRQLKISVHVLVLYIMYNLF